MTDAKWIAALREECALVAGEDAADTPVTYSPGFEKRMDDLCARMRTGKYRRVYGRARVMLIAAIVMVFLMTAVAGAAVWRAVIGYNHEIGDNVFHVEGGAQDAVPGSIKARFIPDRFAETVGETHTDDGYQLVMRSDGGEWLAVTVRPAGADHLFDASRGENDWIEVDGEAYYRHRSVTETAPYTYASTLFFTDGRYTYNVCEWRTDGYADDGELAAIIRGVSPDA